MNGPAHPKPVVPIALVEDDRPFRGYIAALLSATPGWRVVLEADSVEDALRRSASLRPRVLLLDIGLPGRSGAEAVGQFLQAWPDVNVVMLTALEGDDVVLEAIRAGACGYVLKGSSSDELLAAVADALAGGAPMSPSIARRVLALLRSSPPEAPKVAEAPGGVLPLLTPRELEVVALVADGLSDKEIATRLETAVPTVKNHLASIYGKWRVRSRTEAAVRFVKVAGK